jgi:membrane associated rhomboid family serine protease
MLSGPLTWVMNVVWLIPLGVLVVKRLRRKRPRRESIALAVIAVGLLMAAVPDDHAFPLLFPAEGAGAPAGTMASLFDAKYVVAEVVVLAGLVLELAFLEGGAVASPGRRPRGGP